LDRLRRSVSRMKNLRGRTSPLPDGDESGESLAFVLGHMESMASMETPVCGREVSTAPPIGKAVKRTNEALDILLLQPRLLPVRGHALGLPAGRFGRQHRRVERSCRQVVGCVHSERRMHGQVATWWLGGKMTPRALLRLQIEVRCRCRIIVR
jgi:hypothetical protein